MKKFLISVLLLFGAVLLMTAQNDRTLKQIRLKSGMKISGYVQNNDDESINVTTVDGDQFWYHNSEVASITDDPSVVAQKKEVEARAKQEEALAKAEAARLAKEEKKARLNAIRMKEKGFEMIVEGGSSTMLGGGEARFLPTMSIIPGYRLNKHLFVGASVGVNNVFWNMGGSDYDVRYTSYGETSSAAVEKRSLSCYGNTAFSAELLMRLNFKAKRVTPYIMLRGGLGFLPNGAEYYHDSWSAPQDLFGGQLPEVNSAALAGGELGWMFRTRWGGGLHIGLDFSFSPSPDFSMNLDGASRFTEYDIYEYSGTITMQNMYSVGFKAGCTF